jgi:hypothetical protein
LEEYHPRLRPRRPKEAFGLWVTFSDLLSIKYLPDNIEKLLMEPSFAA